MAQASTPRPFPCPPTHKSHSIFMEMQCSKTWKKNGSESQRAASAPRPVKRTRDRKTQGFQTAFQKVKCLSNEALPTALGSTWPADFKTVLKQSRGPPYSTEQRTAEVQLVGNESRATRALITERGRGAGGWWTFTIWLPSTDQMLIKG